MMQSGIVCKAKSLNTQRLCRLGQLRFGRRRCLPLFPLTQRIGGFDHSTSKFACNATPWRPSLDDVDRISRGDAAKIRGTGSRMIPHRLNQEERKLYDFAKRKGFLTVRGTGYRRERKGSPLANSFRQWCDARQAACVVIEQDRFGGTLDTVVVDVSTLRLADPSPALNACRQLLEPLDVVLLSEVDRPVIEVPFSIIPAGFFGPKTPGEVPQVSSINGEEALSSSIWTTASELPSLPEAHEAVELQASVVRNLKAQGRRNKDPAVVAEVKTLLRLKERLQLAECAAASLQQLADTSALVDSPVEHGACSIRNSGSGESFHSGSTSSARGPAQGTILSATEAGTADARTNTATACSACPSLNVESNSSSLKDNMEVGLRCRDAGNTTSLVSTEQAEPRMQEDSALQQFVAADDEQEALADGFMGGDLPSDHPIYTCSIWQIPAQPLFIRARRPVAKEVASLLVAQLPRCLKGMKVG